MHYQEWQATQVLMLGLLYKLNYGKKNGSQTFLYGKNLQDDNRLVFYKNRVVVPQDSHIIPQLLWEFHDSHLGGDSKLQQTYKRLTQKFYWPSMHRVVHEYVSSCDVCQRANVETLSQVGLLQPLPIPCQVWDDIIMDFIEGLPTSNDKTLFLWWQIASTNQLIFLPLAHPFTAKTMAEKFVEGMVKLHGMPRTIISDQDLVFIIIFGMSFSSFQELN